MSPTPAASAMEVTRKSIARSQSASTAKSSACRSRSSAATTTASSGPTERAGGCWASTRRRTRTSVPGSGVLPRPPEPVCRLETGEGWLPCVVIRRRANAVKRLHRVRQAHFWQVLPSAVEAVRHRHSGITANMARHAGGPSDEVQRDAGGFLQPRLSFQHGVGGAVGGEHAAKARDDHGPQGQRKEEFGEGKPLLFGWSVHERLLTRKIKGSPSSGCHRTVTVIWAPS